MLDRQRGTILFECDGCGEVLDAGTGDFEDARVQLRTRGWRAKKIGDVWNHYCKDCNEGSITRCAD